MCGKDPLEFWKYTPSETVLMIEQAGEQLQYESDRELRRQSELLVAIMNAPHFHKQDKKPYDMDDFLPKKKKDKPTIEQYELMLRNSTIAMGGNVIYK